jgi:plasmid stabilization system protein ParE
MILRPLEIRPQAEREAREAAQWYQHESPGLGPAFLEVVEHALGRIAENPLQFPVVHRDIRRALLRQFPYGVFFRIRPGAIRVLAIVHLSRDPSTWQKRR